MVTLAYARRHHMQKMTVKELNRSKRYIFKCFLIQVSTYMTIYNSVESSMKWLDKHCMVHVPCTHEGPQIPNCSLLIAQLLALRKRRWTIRVTSSTIGFQPLPLTPTVPQVASTFLATRCPSRHKQLCSSHDMERPYRCWPTSNNFFLFTHKLNSAKAIHYTYMFFLVFKYIDPHFGFHPMEHFLMLLINIFVSRLNSGSLQ